MNTLNLSAGLILLLTSAAFASGSATIPNQYYGSKPEIHNTKIYPSKMHPAISRAHQVPAEKKTIPNPKTVTEDVKVPVKTQVLTPTAKDDTIPSKFSSVKADVTTASVKEGKPIVTPTPPKQSHPIVGPSANTAPKGTPLLTEKADKPRDNSQGIKEQSPTVATVTRPNKVPVPLKIQVDIPQVDPIIIAIPEASSVEIQVLQAEPTNVSVPTAVPVEIEVPEAVPSNVSVPTATAVEVQVPIARPIKVVYPEANE